MTERPKAALSGKASPRASSDEFARQHLAACAAEILEWQNTGVLPDGKLRELASLCAEWAGEDSALGIAERLVAREALRTCAAG